MSQSDYKTLNALKLYHDTMVRDQCDTFFAEGVHLYFVKDSSAYVSMYLMWSKMCEWLKCTYFVKEFTSYSSFVEYISQKFTLKGEVCTGYALKPLEESEGVNYDLQKP